MKKQLASRFSAIPISRKELQIISGGGYALPAALCFTSGICYSTLKQCKINCPGGLPECYDVPGC